MGLQDFVVELGVLHDKAKKGTLDHADKGNYDRSRDELATALLAAQQFNMRPNERPRSQLRVPRAIQVEIDRGNGGTKTMTVEIGGGGFSALLSEQIETGKAVQASLRLPGGDPIKVEATVTDARRQGSSIRVGFQIKKISDEGLARLEFAVFDEVIARLTKK